MQIDGITDFGHILLWFPSCIEYGCSWIVLGEEALLSIPFNFHTLCSVLKCVCVHGTEQGQKQSIVTMIPIFMWIQKGFQLTVDK